MPTETSGRKLTTLLAADVAGYSRLTSQDEEGTIAALRKHRTELIDPLLERYNGRIANTAGVQPPQFVPLIWPFSTNVSGTGARMPSA